MPVLVIFNVPIIYLILYRTKKGIKLMKNFAKKYEKYLNYLGIISVVIAYIGMIFIVIFLGYNVIKSFFVSQPAALQLVLPVKTKGVFYVPFFEWILSIFIIAFVHEFAHGIFSAKFKLKIKSTGFALFGLIAPIIPAAFVEPDEEQLKKRSFKEQSMVYSAGPVSNILLSLIIILILLLIPSNAIDHFYNKSVKITGFMDQSPLLGLIENNSYIVGIYDIENQKKYNISSVQDLTKVIKEMQYNKTYVIYYIPNFTNSNFTDNFTTNNFSNIPKSTQEFNASSVNKSDVNKIKNVSIVLKNIYHQKNVKLGIYVEQENKIKEEYSKGIISLFVNFITWLLSFLALLSQLNIGIGLANLLPLGIVDGGRLLELVLLKYFNKEIAKKIWIYISTLTLIAILISLFQGIL